MVTSRPASPTDRPHGRKAPPPYEGTFEPMPGQVVRDGHVQWGSVPERPSAEHLAALAPSQSTTRKSTAGLDPYVPSVDEPWDRTRALHLLRRTGFGATLGAVNATLAMSPEAAVDALVNGALALPPMPEPAWANEAPPHWSEPEDVRRQYTENTNQWANEYEWEVYQRFMGEGADEPLARASIAFRERLTLFWHDHFVTHWGEYFLAPWLHRYWSLLRRNAFGDFRQFVHEVGIDPAMLVYLNGVENRVGRPNENYARELLELFTMGILAPDGSPNYTESDVQELSRVLTGWGVDYYGDLDAHFIQDWHDPVHKTVFGQTGAWDYTDIVPLIFSARGPEIAHFICRKLYRAFVYAEPDEVIVSEMATLFTASEWEIEPVVRALLKSEHFFSGAFSGSIVKSPVENAFGYHVSMGRPVDPERQSFLWWAMWLAGQVVFEPPTVAGWPGHHEWVDTSTIAMRWMLTEWYVDGDEALTSYILTLPSAYDAEALARDLSDLMLGQPLAPEALETAVEILLNGAPAYEWDPQAPGAVWRLRALAAHFGRLPEHQLV